MKNMKIRDTKKRTENKRIREGDYAKPGVTVQGEWTTFTFDAEKEDIVLIVETAVDLVLRKLNLELKKILPVYMLPTRLICLAQFPQTPNGKIDRISLRNQLKGETL